MHAKPDLRVFLQWLIARSGSVITDVITLNNCCMLARRRMLVLISLVLVAACTLQLARESRGPNATTAYRWVFDHPAPEYVTSLRSDYYSHLKGYGLYLGFTVPPSRINEIIDTESSRPLFRENLNLLEPWQHENKFVEMFPDDPPNAKACRKTGRTNDGESWSIVYNPTTGNVYCFYISDSDIKP